MTGAGTMSQLEGEAAAAIAAATRDAIVSLPADSELRSEMEQAVFELRALAVSHGVDPDRRMGERPARLADARPRSRRARRLVLVEGIGASQ